MLQTTMMMGIDGLGEVKMKQEAAGSCESTALLVWYTIYCLSLSQDTRNLLERDGKFLRHPLWNQIALERQRALCSRNYSV